MFMFVGLWLVGVLFGFDMVEIGVIYVVFFVVVVVILFVGCVVV